MTAAAASVFSPVIASVTTVFDIQKLSDYQSDAVSLPIISQGFLLSLTLPSLPGLSQNKTFMEARSEQALIGPVYMN
jgi:hypothetical protein